MRENASRERDVLHRACDRSGIERVDRLAKLRLLLLSFSFFTSLPSSSLVLFLLCYMLIWCHLTSRYGVTLHRLITPRHRLASCGGWVVASRLNALKIMEVTQ